MTQLIAIHHVTEYKFDRPVTLSPHQIRLRPAPHCRTPINSYSLKIEPKNHFINWQQDAYGNHIARIVFPEETRNLKIEVEVIAEMLVVNPFDFFMEDFAEEFPFEYDPLNKRELAPYLESEPLTPLLKKWLATVDTTQKIRTIDFLVAINARLQSEIDYGTRMEPGIQSVEETLTLKKGSCRDTAWLLVQILRHLGLAARFASGYLVQLKADQKSLDGPSGTDEDFTDLHAWTEVYIPGAGWIGLDPTSGLLVGEGHIPLACTAEPASAAPMSGATSQCEVEFEFFNKIYRIHEDPRVTLPYSESQWAEIDLLGEAVDQQLHDGDVRLMMGGEPTFVSIDDMDSAQWNTEALGDDKLRLAKDLLIRLRNRFAPGGLLHYGQGKWYPGEETPRWALGCFWRTDGENLWHNPELLARIDRNYGMTLENAQLFITTLIKRLGIGSEFAHCAFEDPFHYASLEQHQPLNIDLTKINIDDSLERKRLVNLLTKGLSTPTGYVLPLGWNYGNQRWQSCHWNFRSEKMLLIPGDSPMGYRLPLDSLIYAPQEEQERPQPQDPFDERPSLAGYRPYADMKPVEEAENGMESADQDTRDDARSLMRTALCVEPRNGKLHCFLPPMECLEQYVDMLSALEATASELEMPIIIEGYEAPRDPRLQKLLVTPDPGVIEVNIHPADSWTMLRNNTLALYEEARQSRLCAEKFMLDGRHTGTGGGNHVTLGGRTAADSPMLRRPELLRSLVNYWQHHPGLSYLFSGMFVGPTSQAPRVDEGRTEALYELELAFARMPEGFVDQPWIVDRLMRNLLVDVTGNTHRSEFCIDKLYAAGSASGRQGILEFRGFEMPPHPQMALVQALLIRALVARFWEDPYHKPLVRWGTELHDRFLLPQGVRCDLEEVVADLQAQGIPFQMEWLEPFFEFRFPRFGSLQIGQVNMELRWAIEPWNVLGEEITSFGTARFVDSSVERVQLKLTGLSDNRYQLHANGYPVPLKSTGTAGEYYAGVRYRAWDPESALHPGLGVDAPIVFDLVDTWNGRSVGGFTYYVSHAGGRNYETLPVNANEAEGRRVSRYQNQGHTPGVIAPVNPHQVKREVIHEQTEQKLIKVPKPQIQPEYPCTLDLRLARVQQ